MPRSMDLDTEDLDIEEELDHVLYGEVEALLGSPSGSSSPGGSGSSGGSSSSGRGA